MSNGTPLISATMIVRNDNSTILRAVESVWDHVDEFVVVDTGSTDGTIGTIRQYAKRRKQTGKLKVGRFEWCDDFAAARQAADDLATGEWLIWLDADDEVLGASNLRVMVQNAAEDVAAFFCHYQYAHDEHRNIISELWRERVVRNDGTQWQGRLHEHKLIVNGAVVQVSPEHADWVHHRDHTQRTGDRNLQILEKWDRDEPNNPRIVQSIAMEYLGMERHSDASDAFGRYLQMEGEPPDRRAQATRHMSVMLLIQGRGGEARAAALQSLQELWGWADTHLTLAEVAQAVGRPDEGYVHAKQALDLGKPQSLLILNPLQYTAHPLALMTLCLMQLGRLEEANERLEECLRISPSYPLALQCQPMLHAALRKDRAALSWLANAQTLVEAGEPIKARDLLDLAPWYVAADERLIGRRGELARLIADRSKGETLVEDPDAVEFVARMAA